MVEPLEMTVIWLRLLPGAVTDCRTLNIGVSQGMHCWQSSLKAPLQIKRSILLRQPFQWLSQDLL